AAVGVGRDELILVALVELVELGHLPVGIDQTLFRETSIRILVALVAAVASRALRLSPAR
ncbi:MAG TPA: hypothetical protein VLJ14_16305, partial [Ktedonobacterales bacterium]|nr:hypothetical protein [Ktedonobacterales bacterium]